MNVSELLLLEQDLRALKETPLGAQRTFRQLVDFLAEDIWHPDSGVRETMADTGIDRRQTIFRQLSSRGWDPDSVWPIVDVLTQPRYSSIYPPRPAPKIEEESAIEPLQIIAKRATGYDSFAAAKTILDQKTVSDFLIKIDARITKYMNRTPFNREDEASQLRFHVSELNFKKIFSAIQTAIVEDPKSFLDYVADRNESFLDTVWENFDLDENPDEAWRYNYIWDQNDPEDPKYKILNRDSFVEMVGRNILRPTLRWDMSYVPGAGESSFTLFRENQILSGNDSMKKAMKWSAHQESDMAAQQPASMRMFPFGDEVYTKPRPRETSRRIRPDMMAVKVKTFKPNRETFVYKPKPLANKYSSFPSKSN